MRKQILNKIIEIASMYWSIDLFNLLELSQKAFFTLKSILKNKSNEKDNH